MSKVDYLNMITAQVWFKHGEQLISEPPDSVDKIIILNAHNALDGYAKEVAIDFAAWTRDSNYVVNSMGQWFSYESDENPTDEQLFEKYLSEKQNIK